ncbi:hypothetical protein J2Z17_005076 [Rhizobium halophytocola]|uniref:Uncharacterized protein n=1 Tax=Rhizobium halophytocola TaxID=735519 RepID=A0ABS4E6R4_9HYPH|nr:hypothetical protein [Rhizobium halophytocola]
MMGGGRLSAKRGEREAKSLPHNPGGGTRICHSPAGASDRSSGQAARQGPKAQLSLADCETRLRLWSTPTR